MISIYDSFGRGMGYRDAPRLAREAGLIAENIHAPVQTQNDLSRDDLAGEDLFSCYLQCVRDCAAERIPTMVVHLPDDTHPLTALGMQRVHRIAEEAEKLNVNVAMENLFNIRNLHAVLDTIHTRHIGFCYDSCHHANNKDAGDLLTLYGDRLMALHLHDNGGARNQHQLPLDGNVDWPDVMRRITATGYRGATALEPMNWGYEALTVEEYLAKAAQKAKTLDALRTNR